MDPKHFSAGYHLFVSRGLIVLMFPDEFLEGIKNQSGASLIHKFIDFEEIDFWTLSISWWEKFQSEVAFSVFMEVVNDLFIALSLLWRWPGEEEEEEFDSF